MPRKKRLIPAAEAAAAPQALWEVGLYGRLSVLDNGKTDGDPIESQIKIMEQFISSRPELHIADRYLDNGYTGTNFERPEWERLIRDVKTGKVNCIIVKDLSRLGRNYIEAGDFLERTCPELGVRFISVNDHYDTQALHSQDELTVSGKNIINDYYAKDISMKSGAALKAKRQNGEYIGSYAPHGYQKDPENKNRLLVDPETAPVIQQIYEWRAQGFGIGTIARMLNERGIPSPGRYRFEHGIITNNNKKGTELLWNRHALTDILHNIAYIGHLAQGKSTASLIRGIPFHRTKESEWDIAYNTHEPILEEDLFYRVQAVNQERTAAYHANFGACAHLPKKDNPYRKKLVCADCGTQMKLYRNLSRDRKKAYFVYLCPTYEEHRELKCVKKSIRSDDLDNAVLQALRVQMDLFCNAQEVLAKLAEKKPGTRAKGLSDQNELHKIRQEIKRKQGYALALYEDYKSGLLTKEECVLAREKYQKEIAELNEKAAMLESREDRVSRVLEKTKPWAKMFEQYRSAEHITKELVAAFVDQIRVAADGSIQIAFLFDDALHGLRAQCKSLRGEVA